MISDTSAEEAFVWVWLPDSPDPVVAGRVVKQGERFFFAYGQSYRANPSAIALSPFELPLEAGTFEPMGMNPIHACLRDAAPDVWGRRVLGYRYPAAILTELDYLLLSGSDRIGALDFQRSATDYQPRGEGHASLEELLQAAERVEKGQPIPPDLDAALLHGTSVGGARPKALITEDDKTYIAKFSSTTDTYPIVKAEYIAMRLGEIAGLTVAPVKLVQSMGKDVLLVERFDRYLHEGAMCCRRQLLSGLSLLRLDEMEARYASYLDLAEVIRHRFIDPKQQLTELFKRMAFNVMVGNTDDHARNHAAFWNGRDLSLTPAYDICPQLRTGREATQAMDIGGDEGRMSTLKNVLSVCRHFQIEEPVAKDVINALLASVERHWQQVCDEVDLPVIERERLWGKAVFNPYCLQGW